MKLTRTFLLKCFDEDQKNYNNDDPINSLKTIILTNSNIDIIISLILSILYVLTIFFINNKFYELYPINFIIFVKLNIFLSIIFILVESLRITIITWEKYLRSLNKPQSSSERSSLQSNKSRNSSINLERTSKNSGSNIDLKNRIEMDDLDEKKNPFIPKKGNECEKPNYFGSSKNYIFNEGNKFNIINSKKDYIEVYYESILLSPNNTFFDKIFIKIYIFLIKKLNQLIERENEGDTNNKQKKNSLYKIIIKYPHTISSIFHFLINILFLFSFGFSFAFFIIYSSLKSELSNYSFNKINLFIGECLELYYLFRLCFFFIKIIVNFSISPIYISAIYLGYYEDEFNIKLNELIKTRFYTGKKCLISRDSINKLSENEIDESCAICINRYIKGDVISTLPCSKRHSFHTYCLEEWFRTSVSCPLCRCDFSNEIGVYLGNDLENENNNNNQDQNINNEQFFNLINPNNIFNQNNNNNNLNNNINIVGDNNENNINNNLENNINHYERQGANRENVEMRELNNNS